MSVEHNGERSTAKLTCRMPGELDFRGTRVSPEWGNTRMGKIDFCMECEFDLSDPDNAVLNSVHFGQAIDMTMPPGEAQA